ncbi:MAG: EamA family transporter [Anaerocolumna sp.]
MMQYYLIILIMTIIGACASYCLKKASSSKQFKNIITMPALYLGVILYLIAACLNIFVLRYMEYSIVLPLTSITYVWTFILSYFYLHEKMTLKKGLGIVFVVLGSMILTL